MARSLAKTALIVALVPLGAVAASAQFGSIFGDPPPRPPGAVPGGRPPATTAVPPAAAVPPPATARPPALPSGPYGAIQTQPLAPPPGVAVPDPAAPAVVTLPPPDPGAGLPREPLPPGVLPPGSVPPTEAAPPPADEAVAEPPRQKIVNTAALFSGLDKITGRITNFDVAIGETVQFGALQLTPRACYTRPATEATNTDAFVEVDEVTLQGEVRRIFTGWMFAASPGLHAVEHPIYDLWLTDCKGAVVAERPPEPPAAAPAPPAARTPPRSPAQPKRAPTAAPPPGALWPAPR